MQNFRCFKSALLQTTLIAGTLFGACSYSDNQKSENAKTFAEKQNEEKFNAAKKKKDAQFLVYAAEINLAEIKLGQLAQQNSLMSYIKELGEMMEEAHSKSMTDLIVLAKKKLIVIPTSPSINAQDAYHKLSKKSGTDFDRAYCNMTVNGHRNALTTFEKASRESSDADIKEWATATLPFLRTCTYLSREMRRNVITVNNH